MPGCDDLARRAAEIRREILDILIEVGPEHRGHPGGCLSIVDLVTALYFGTLTIDPARPDWPDRDRFVLSKGHGCLAVYVALAQLGYFDPAHLRTFRFVDSLLQGHPDMRRTPGIDMTSGSLGHGLSVGVGMALDARARHSPAHVYVLLGRDKKRITKRFIRRLEDLGLSVEANPANASVARAERRSVNLLPSIRQKR